MVEVSAFAVDNCPSCGMRGRRLGKELRECPACATVFGEFGLVREGEGPNHRELN